MARIGFMQGRLSPMVDGRIQAFPWRHWEGEFDAAQAIGIPLMEWTLDQERLRENPLLTSAGRARIAELTRRTGLRVESVTGDCFMQAPFYKADGPVRAALMDDFTAVIDATAAVGAKLIVFPLVDNGSLETAAHEAALREGLAHVEPRLRGKNVRIAFESDFGPERLAQFISTFPADVFGINYDIGNSASLGFDPDEEIGAYGERVTHVHVKDRVRGGTTVPLGTGSARFERVFAGLRRAGYRGDFVLQTARAADGKHAEALARYRDMTETWWEASGSRT
ncbi:MAG TPA: sugar phosphate isomerase/epimerase family protein [Burkholderiales bacterium]|nr:sugar phosphate isomerase/epimerase family protein [Burkholderiales bacterium]